VSIRTAMRFPSRRPASLNLGSNLEILCLTRLNWTNFCCYGRKFSLSFCSARLTQISWITSLICKIPIPYYGKSSYDAQFAGKVTAPDLAKIPCIRAEPKERFFIWLSLNRLWTPDRLLSDGMCPTKILAVSMIKL
jgi:hypothetical protein